MPTEAVTPQELTADGLACRGHAGAPLRHTAELERLVGVANQVGTVPAYAIAQGVAEQATRAVATRHAAQEAPQ